MAADQIKLKRLRAECVKGKAKRKPDQFKFQVLTQAWESETLLWEIKIGKGKKGGLYL